MEETAETAAMAVLYFEETELAIKPETPFLD